MSHPTPTTGAPSVPTRHERAASVQALASDLAAAARTLEDARSPESIFDAELALWAATERAKDNTRLRAANRAAIVVAGRRVGLTDKAITARASAHRPVAHSRIRQFLPQWTGTIGLRGCDDE